MSIGGVVNLFYFYRVFIQRSQFRVEGFMRSRMSCV